MCLCPRSFVWLSLTVLLCNAPTPALAESQQPDQQSSAPSAAPLLIPVEQQLSCRVSLAREDQPQARRRYRTTTANSLCRHRSGTARAHYRGGALRGANILRDRAPGGNLRRAADRLGPCFPKHAGARLAHQARRRKRKSRSRRSSVRSASSRISSSVYDSTAAPLGSKQKFRAGRADERSDPVTFVLTGVTAGVEQAQNDFSGYGQGAQGYGKTATAPHYADIVDRYVSSEAPSCRRS